MKEKQDCTLRFWLDVWVTEYAFVGRFHPFIQGTQAIRMSRGIALLFLGPWHTRWWWGGQLHAPAASTPGKIPLQILQRARSFSGPVWTGLKSCHHRRSIPNRPDHSSVAIPTELPGPPCSWICVYVNVVANGAMLDIFTACFYNLIWKPNINYLYLQFSQPPPPFPPPVKNSAQPLMFKFTY